ncbi:gfo/Idh/MocA family oxidoreductase [Pseudoroseomonas wenyumeiae]|uniref:Gfo/Idh/MocA family oxidoreductase n=1 Tax=Teichococcus wenyumeiae TaxID=2478470 RepID=A0A3A9JGZ8_9PROT|nr:Gfo/Idh/MocA family oxidoreductase [Pseudoroseomonas wenyumeiae]RKK05640.1 gfo/Idh/MocA family oxidoreductase [Pseudoroseomonas wenyumeiae]RMI25092.1 gfo/Idh/MocA family oxidoreductase [Pseudoroseomonas wenyumeiae]
MSTRHRIGVIGLGMAVTPHARSLLDLAERVEVAGTYARSAARRDSFAQRFPFPATDQLDTILEDSSVDCVMILTPPDTHLDLVRRCAAAGKHILLEKPLEITTARAEQLVAACREAGVTLGLVLQHRFRPAAVQFAALQREGQIGNLIAASASIRLWRPQSYYDEPGRGTLARDGGGVLITQGIHTLDLLQSLAGPVAEVTGYATTSPVHRMETEDLACAAVRFASGAMGTIEATTAAFPGFPERIELTGKRATASLTGVDLHVQHQDGRVTELRPGGGGGTGADPMAFPHDYHRSVLADFLDALDQGREPAASGADALRVHYLVDALLESSRTGRPCRVKSI